MQIEISVADNGIGMDEETQARLFTAFTQGDASTTRRFGGTGLGLAISRQLVELMGGELILQSRPDHGATFSVRIPFALPPVPDGGAGCGAPQAPSKERPLRPSGALAAAFKAPSRDAALRDGRLILVAEDNETNQKVILYHLALLGFAADVADNGRLALARWQNGGYALLLSDLHMPEMDGYELTCAIRAQEQGSSRIPILALTANTLKGEAERCRAVGMDDYLSKPLQLADLKTALDRWLPTAAAGPHSLRRAVAVDVAVLESLIGSDPGVILEFLNDFQVSAAKIALDLKAACAERMPGKASEQAHKLKSSARTVGASALGELCAQIETAGKAGNIDALAALLPMFEQELDAVNAFLNERQGAVSNA